jgi:hypothetical protein
VYRSFYSRLLRTLWGSVLKSKGNGIGMDGTEGDRDGNRAEVVVLVEEAEGGGGAGDCG